MYASALYYISLYLSKHNNNIQIHTFNCGTFYILYMLEIELIPREYMQPDAILTIYVRLCYGEVGAVHICAIYERRYRASLFVYSLVYLSGSLCAENIIYLIAIARFTHEEIFFFL